MKMRKYRVVYPKVIIPSRFKKTEAWPHSLRVGKDLAVFSQELGMPAKLLKKIGVFHDLGKYLCDESHVYDGVVWTAEVRASFRKEHSEKGFQFLKDKDVEEEVRQGALRHHYADANDPQWLQLLRLVDAADALLAKRCYKAAMPEDKVKAAMPEDKVRKILQEEHCACLSAEACKVFWDKFDQIKAMT